MLTHGANKYGAYNWKGGIATSRLLSAVFRHITSWNDGEDNDPETGVSHLAHACCSLMFIIDQMKRMPLLDDRYIDDKKLPEWIDNDKASKQ